MLHKTTLQNIAKKYGTPVYVYDLDQISIQYHKLLSAFPEFCSVFFASKALSNIHILNYMKSIGLCIETSSLNEVKLGLLAGHQAKNIIYNGNGIDFAEIYEIVQLGVFTLIDSISNVEKFGKHFGSEVPLGIRWRPNISDGGNIKISTGHAHSKFGIPIEQADQVLKLQKKYGLNMVAQSIHTGSELQKIDSFKKQALVFKELLSKFPKTEILDFGGGFKVPYRETEKEFDPNLLTPTFVKLHKELTKIFQRSFRFWVEPGKFLVASSGYLIAKINVIKDNPEQTLLCLNTGFNHLIRPMYYGAYHPIEPLTNRKTASKKYTIVGNLCETDTFATGRYLPTVKENDFLVFKMAGAYGFEMSSHYNSRLKPVQVAVLKDNFFLISQPDTIENITQFQQNLEHD